MARRKPSSKKKEAPQKPRVHPDLDGFNIEVNSFGEVTTSFDIDKINIFLNKNVEDKKFRGRNDIAGRDYDPETDELPLASEEEPDENEDISTLLNDDMDDFERLDDDDDHDGDRQR